MAPHPARLVGYADLLAGLEERVRRGAVRRVPDPRTGGRLVGYVYTKRCVYEGAWDEVTTLAHGLVLDVESERVVATPFPKFFNLGEPEYGSTPDEADAADEHFDAFEKVDGSLGVAFHDHGTWRVATKGSFESPQSAWAEEWLGRRALDALSPGTTYCLEIVNADNRIVVRYDDEALVVLGAFDAAGDELDDERLAAVASALGTRTARRLPFERMAQVVDAAGALGLEEEGYVVRYASGLRVKVKGAAYLHVHRLLSRVAPLGVWQVLVEGGDDAVERFRREIPEEFRADLDRIAALLRAELDALVARVDAEVADRADLSDKELGLVLAEIPDPVRRHVFPARRAGAGWAATPRSRAGLLRNVRPDHDRLAGYVPSAAWRRATDDG